MSSAFRASGSLLPFASWLMLAGCGGVVDVSSGLPPNKLGEDLTEIEIEQLCRAVGDYAERHPRDESAVCRLLGIVAVSEAVDTVENARVVCTGAYDACTPIGGTPDTFCSNLDIAGPTLTACTSTVEEIEACLQVDIARTTEIANSLRYCDEIDLDYVNEWYDTLSQEMRTPEGCESVRQNCPQVLN